VFCPCQDRRYISVAHKQADAQLPLTWSITECCKWDGLMRGGRGQLAGRRQAADASGRGDREPELEIVRLPDHIPLLQSLIPVQTRCSLLTSVAA
jgi:hypothetical protein